MSAGNAVRWARHAAARSRSPRPAGRGATRRCGRGPRPATPRRARRGRPRILVVSGMRQRTSWYLPPISLVGDEARAQRPDDARARSAPRWPGAAIVVGSSPPMLMTSPRASGVSSAAHEAVDRVLHVSERPHLAAVAVDLDQLAVEQALDERRLRAAPPARVVARAVGAEEAQDRRPRGRAPPRARARGARRRASRRRTPSGAWSAGRASAGRPRRTAASRCRRRRRWRRSMITCASRASAAS